MIETVFLDRDGTINRKALEGRYITAPDELELLPGAADAVAAVGAAGKRVVVVTNQRGVALGHMTSADVALVNARMLEELGAAGGRIDAIYVCPHDYGQCDCRKPASGMFEQAKRDFPEIVFSRSVVIGDTESDMQAARRIGAIGIRVGDPDVPDLMAAVSRICGPAAGQSQ
jgi:D-glycero-D-manno-heptose 1,7-bisphosphate phosphatase